jgi:cytochrome P450
VLAKVSEVDIPPPWTPEGHPNALAWYAAMHQRGPMAVDDDTGALLFVGYDEVREILMQAETWSIAKRIDHLPPEKRVVRLLTSDPPVHMKLKNYFMHSYRPQRISALEQRIRIVCNELLDNCLENDTFDVVADFVKPLAVIMICEILGIPEEGRKAALSLAGSGAALGRVEPLSVSNLVERMFVGEAPAHFAGNIVPYYMSLIEERRRAPQDDLISALAKIPPEEIEGFVNIPALMFEQFGAGTNTTVHVFASMIASLDQHRDAKKRLWSDPGLVPTTVEESVRLHTPLQFRPRTLTRDIELDGRTYREGTWALVWHAAANVDPTKFDRPLEYDITRSPNPHVGFSYGEHVCLGMHLARMELRVALETWLERIEDYELANEPLVWLPDFALHGLEYLHVKAQPRHRPS